MKDIIRYEENMLVMFRNMLHAFSQALKKQSIDYYKSLFLFTIPVCSIFLSLFFSMCQKSVHSSQHLVHKLSLYRLAQH